LHPRDAEHNPLDQTQSDLATRLVVAARWGDTLRRESASSRSVFDVFTPTTQARVNFIERDSVNDRLVDALRTPGKQIIVYGDSGSGKSTLLLRKLEQLYESHITSRCSAASTFTSILLDTFDQLDTHYVDSRSTSLSNSKKASIQLEIAKAKATYEKQTADSTGSATNVPFRSKSRPNGSLN
jgi:hypothetical protein